MSTEDRRRKLLAAASLVEEVMATLDTRSEECPCCHLSHRENWAEYQAYQELAGTVRKLRANADRLRTSKAA